MYAMILMFVSFLVWMLFVRKSCCIESCICENCSENQHRLIQLEEAARAAGKGKWGVAEEVQKHVRSITWTIENPRLFVDSHHQKPIDGLCETFVIRLNILFLATV